MSLFKFKNKYINSEKINYQTWLCQAVNLSHFLIAFVSHPEANMSFKSLYRSLGFDLKSTGGAPARLLPSSQLQKPHHRDRLVEGSVPGPLRSLLKLALASSLNRFIPVEPLFTGSISRRRFSTNRLSSFFTVFRGRKNRRSPTAAIFRPNRKEPSASSRFVCPYKAYHSLLSCTKKATKNSSIIKIPTFISPPIVNLFSARTKQVAKIPTSPEREIISTS